ncbi:MAG: DUF2357 domain-containing protein [Chloroflexota bacterium]
MLRWKVGLSPNGVVGRYEGCDDHGKPKDSPLARMLLRWSSFFDELLEEAQRENESNERLQWQAVKNHLEKLRKEAKEPFRAVIVDIAETMRRSLPEIVRAARRILLRERQLLPARRMEETDGACLHWYIRQPGRTMAEKAGPRQKLLMVARRETHNLHENRILKDFLRRCSGEGKRYIANTVSESTAFRTSKRIHTVQALATLCSKLAAVSHLDDVSLPNPATPPNYVLLNDIRYRWIWYWYKKLLRQEQEKDRFWDWQARTWADIARLLVSVAIILYQEQCTISRSLRISTLYEGALRVRSEQILGCRAAAGSETGPLLIERYQDGHPGHRAIMEIVHPDQAENHPIACHLGATGGHLYLVLRPVGRNAPAHILIVWAAHTAASSHITDWGAIGNSAFKALQGHQALMNMARISPPAHLRGLVLCSRLDTNKSEIEFEQGGLRLVSVPTTPRNWIGAAQNIALALDDVLEEMTG